MKTIATVLEKYIAADEEDRLSMYLAHRSLRRQFNKIDLARKTGPAESAATAAASLKPDGSGKSRPAFHCWGWLKHCRSVR